jgi:hypothetical protein
MQHLATGDILHENEVIVDICRTNHQFIWLLNLQKVVETYTETWIVSVFYSERKGTIHAMPLMGQQKINFHTRINGRCDDLQFILKCSYKR